MIKDVFKNLRGYIYSLFIKMGLFGVINYRKYWHNRYLSGGNSGSGSYGVLAKFKSDVINTFIEQNGISSVIDFGCGDGSQIKTIEKVKYLGIDVAPSSIDLCRGIFSGDKTKSFLLYNPKYFVNNQFIKADLVMCLDVLYHIIDEADFSKTLSDIFSCSRGFVVLYTNIEIHEAAENSHILYRDIMKYLTQFNEFKLQEVISQKYKDLSCADFIILKRKNIT